jgi:dTDP-4-amino-4,6-dideoxygalactose transaminase
MPNAAFLPYGRQSIDEDDIAAVSNVLRSDWLTGGPAVAQFEQAFARTVGAPHAIACSNGTTALHLAALALDLGPGDAVVVPAITFLASATAFRVQGATIVFADVDPQTGLMTAETCEAAIGREGHNRVRAVVPVHLGGRCSSPADMAAVARRHGAAVVEDACHALGTVYESGAAGKQSAGACADADMAIFSLHPVKSATMGEGGVVTTRDPAIAARVARLRNHGMERSPDAFVDKELGFDKHGAANPWYYEIHELALN